MAILLYQSESLPEAMECGSCYNNNNNKIIVYMYILVNV